MPQSLTYRLLLLVAGCCLALTLASMTTHAQQKARAQDTAEAARLFEQAAELYQAGRYREAIPLAERALAIDEKALGPNHPDVATDLNNLAALYQATGEYARALPLYQRALAIYEKTLGKEHAEVATTLNNLASLYKDTGDYAHAAPLLQRSLAIYEKALGPEHPNVAASLNNLAGLYQATGDYPRAAPLYQRALAIVEKGLGPEHPDVATVLNNLASLYKDTGDYTKALPLHQRALAIREKALGPNHPDVATALNNLAGLYQATGDYARAAPLYQRSLAIREKIFGPEHPNVAGALNNLAGLYQDTRDYSRAAPLYQRALAIVEKGLGQEHPTVAIALNNLAVLYKDQGDYAKAAPLYQRSLAIAEKVLGPEHPDVATALNNLAVLYYTTGDYAHALPLYQRALVIREKVLGPVHPDVALSLNNLAFLYHAQDDFPHALAFLQRARSVEEKNIALVLASGSQQQKQLYLNILSGQTNSPVSWNAQTLPNNPDATRLALTVILQRKGRALDAFSDQIAALHQRANPDDQKLLDELAVTLTRLANLQLGKDSKLAPDALRTEIARLNADKERLEDAISRRSAEFRAVTQPVTLERVQAALPSDAALVELFVYYPFNAQAKPNAQYGVARYVAYILRPKDAAPQFADLGPATDIDTDASRFHAAVQSPKTPDAEVKQLARTLDERVMRPVRKLLGDTRRVFLSPDGALNLVPFAAFVDENGKYLAETYSLTYLTSGRDLLRLQISGQSQDAPTVLANPLFDARKSTNPAATLAAFNRQFGLGDEKTAYRDLDFTQFGYPPLPGTAQEAQALAGVLPGARLWLDAQATEKALKGVARPRILHIATHGFFLPDQTDCGMRIAECGLPERSALLGNPQSAFRIPQSGNPQSAIRIPQSENPLLRSGLILAGVKQRASGAGEDGVLTAQEAAGLNLFGTKLVVLSACETGLGEVQNGQGVYGLRRALVLAGSEAQVMSLWKVADTATAALMTAYYQRLQRGEGRSEAMRQVQLELLKNGKLAQPVGETRKIEQEGEKGKPGPADWRHPYYWASFIQSGAWTNLDGK